MPTASRSTVRDIRPKVLFQLIEAMHPESNPTFSVNIPSSAIGGATLLESAVLVSLARLTGAQSFFEFGTYMGATTLLLATNSPDSAHVTTVDLPPEAIDTAAADDAALVLQDDTANDNFLRREFAAKGGACIDRAPAAIQAKVTRLLQDTRTIDPVAQGLAGRFDFIFIDGGHDYDTIASDTAVALQLARPDAVIAWHDYRSAIHQDVTRFLDGYDAPAQLVHVQNTMIAFMLTGRFANLLPD
ncbi:class I SAM-dependent methyltransferase [Massilia sp. METH4]|uniref:class I SAM-dependent methyltransferase n=1 Tax=Massilia sp. METH4 TaxID=3123041 RepID=UPI0030CCE52C